MVELQTTLEYYSTWSLIAFYLISAISLVMFMAAPDSVYTNYMIPALIATMVNSITVGFIVQFIMERNSKVPDQDTFDKLQQLNIEYHVYPLIFSIAMIYILHELKNHKSFSRTFMYSLLIVLTFFIVWALVPITVASTGKNVILLNKIDHLYGDPGAMSFIFGIVSVVALSALFSSLSLWK